MRPESPDSGAHYIADLNPAQREAVFHDGSPLLILAGAGSGKTRVITTKIAYLVEQRGISPRSILAVAFTNKAAEEMKERVLSLAPAAEEVMIRTFHSFGAWLLRRYAPLAGKPNHFTIYDEEDSRSLLKHLLEDKVQQHRLTDLARRIARAKDRCLGPEDDCSAFELESPLGGMDFHQVYSKYQKRLEQSGGVDFGDLIMLSVRLLESFPEVREEICRRFRIVLVDEYQDSNPAQFMLLSELYDGSNYICVVGDEDQSIYGFRGADVNNILRFPESFPGTRVIRLEQNYRSTQNILEVASRVVENNVNRLGKTLWTSKPSGSQVVFAQLETPNQEARFCAELLRDGNYSGTAILYRMNFQSRVFETQFQNLGIPYRVVGTLRFFEREEVKDALAYLALLVNPGDEVAFRRAVNKPRRGVGPKSVEKILAACRYEEDEPEGRVASLPDACSRILPSLPKSAASGIRTFLSLLANLSERLERSSLHDLVNHLIVESGLWDYYRERDESERGEAFLGLFRLRNLEELVNAAAEYPGGLEGLSRFLENIELSSPVDMQESGTTDRVTLITAHNTKGLEFDRVIITGLEEGIFPHQARMAGGPAASGPELEEERRLFYVGTTRARESLCLTCCRTRTVFGRLKASAPSRFIREIPPQYLQSYGAKPVQTEEPGEEEKDFTVGCSVYHQEYGPGVVTHTWVFEGKRAVAIRFDSGKVARFIPRYTRDLERISRDA